MRQILSEVRDGSFTRELVADDDAGRPNFQKLRQEAADHQIERVGAELRPLMSWLSEND